MLRFTEDDLRPAATHALERLARALGIDAEPHRLATMAEHRARLIRAILQAELRLAKAPSNRELARIVAERADLARRRRHVT